MQNKCLNDIVFFILIAGRKQKDTLLAAMSEAGGHLLDTVYGKGTVKASYIQNVLGLVHEENKVLISCLMSAEKSDAALNMLNEKFNFDKPNTGIAFIIPVESLSF